MTKVCAFMSLFNEEDIIEETVRKLIESGVDIFILDNGCTDGTIEKIQKFVGKGIVDILYFTSEENGKKVFKLEDILEQFEIASLKLDHEWFLISDADEIKYSPWHDVSLSDGIGRVDAMGYNLINFKLYDFRPVNEKSESIELEKRLVYYSHPGQTASVQMKCWKKTDIFDIKSFGGHIVTIPHARLFPVKFINKHYPIRNIQHGIKKIIDERAQRYSSSELKKGWHSHYSAIDLENTSEMLWKEDELTFFDMGLERTCLFEEAVQMLMAPSLLGAMCDENSMRDGLIKFAAGHEICSKEHAHNVFDAGCKIYNLSTQYKLPPIQISSSDEQLMNLVISSLRSVDYFNGQLLKVRNSENIQFIVSAGG